MEIVATMKHSQQISPDDFAVHFRHKICQADTTVGEILEWFEDTLKTYPYKARPCIQLLGVSLSETDKGYGQRSLDNNPPKV